MKMKRYKKIDIRFYIILLIIFFSVVIIKYYDKSIRTSFSNVIRNDIRKNIYNYIYSNFDISVYSIDDIITFDYNNDNEIINVNYRYDNVYKMLSKSLGIIKNNIDNNYMGSKYYVDDKDIYLIPVGIFNNNIIFNNYGFSIPCKIDYFNDIHIYLSNKVKSYGINYLLVEVYMVFEIESTFSNPLDYGSIKDKYEILVCSKLINGKIPTYYGNVIEKNSSIVS